MPAPKSRSSILRSRDGIWGIVLAAGAGSRLGARKQFLRIGESRLVDLSVRATASVCEGLVLVLPKSSSWNGEPVTAVVDGGKTRLESARRGLEAVPSSTRIVVIHDAAHPLASERLFESLIEAVEVRGVDAALPVFPTSDTIMRTRRDQITETIPRDGLVTVQVPQAFKADVLRAAHERGGEASDDGVLVQQFGARIRTVPGEACNIHITTMDDLTMAAQLLRLRPTALNPRPSK